MIKAITVRNIPLGLARKLRQLADERGVSLGKLVVQLLEEATGLKKQKKARSSNLDKYFGVWTEEEYQEFEASLAEQRRIDPEVWKK